MFEGFDRFRRPGPKYGELFQSWSVNISYFGLIMRR